MGGTGNVAPQKRNTVLSGGLEVEGTVSSGVKGRAQSANWEEVSLHFCSHFRGYSGVQFGFAFHTTFVVYYSPPVRRSHYFTWSCHVLSNVMVNCAPTCEQHELRKSSPPSRPFFCPESFG